MIAWKVILTNNGVINSALWQLGTPRRRVTAISWLIYSCFAVGLVLFYSWVPFVALPIYVCSRTWTGACSRRRRTWARTAADLFPRHVSAQPPRVIAGSSSS